MVSREGQATKWNKRSWYMDSWLQEEAGCKNETLKENVTWIFFFLFFCNGNIIISRLQ